tara:strand:- start:307 stop:420 length:114 start_codon:yes stop_codon:yes gene_type:complete
MTMAQALGQRGCWLPRFIKNQEIVGVSYFNRLDLGGP